MAEQHSPERTNRLIRETSPYLLQHAHNPVDWYPWGEEALARARAEGRPILLSVGYSACHWCHVMERESFENPAIAALMNEKFVNVKVDREERPDIDHLYMTAVQMMSGQGGWPMTVFLTPDGKPFYGGTYYPPDDRYGRPGFPRLLLAIEDAWQNRRQECEQQGATLVEHIRETSGAADREEPVTSQLFDQAFQRLERAYDNRLGGFGSAPKFPQPMICDFLHRYAHRTGRERSREMATFTLERMAMGGMYDQLGGGFHRYSTDPYWLVPHFEKMLYDNAQLAQSYLRGWKVTGDPFFRRIVEETLDYVRREMTSPLGGFYSTQDADSEGEEGKFFVWTEEEVQHSLGKADAALFARVYDVTPRGNWEGANILNLTAPPESLARSLGQEPEALLSRLAGMRKKLFEIREQRVKPGRDEKILTGWNGLMLAAFADAAAALGRTDYLETAQRNSEFILSKLYRDGRLLRTGKGEDEGFRASSIPGFLEDYAFFADGLLHLYEATFDLRWLEAARELADTMIALFGDPEGAGFYSTPADGEALIDRPRDLTDNATPAGNSVAIEVLLRLSILTGEASYERTAASILRRIAPMAAQHPQAFGRLLGAMDFYVGPVKEIAVIGEPDDSATHALLSPARSRYLPNLVVMSAASATEGYPLLEGRERIDGRSTAYVCQNFACQQPTSDPDIIAELLT